MTSEVLKHCAQVVWTILLCFFVFVLFCIHINCMENRISDILLNISCLCFTEERKPIIFGCTVPLRFSCTHFLWESNSAARLPTIPPGVKYAWQWQEVVTWLPLLKTNEWIDQNRCLPAVSRGLCCRSPACGSAWRLLEAENDWKSLVVGFYELASAEIVRFMGMISC